MKLFSSKGRNFDMGYVKKIIGLILILGPFSLSGMEERVEKDLKLFSSNESHSCRTLTVCLPNKKNNLSQRLKCLTKEAEPFYPLLEKTNFMRIFHNLKRSSKRFPFFSPSLGDLYPQKINPSQIKDLEGLIYVLKNSPDLTEELGELISRKDFFKLEFHGNDKLFNLKTHNLHLPLFLSFLKKLPPEERKSPFDEGKGGNLYKFLEKLRKEGFSRFSQLNRDHDQHKLSQLVKKVNATFSGGDNYNSLEEKNESTEPLIIKLPALMYDSLVFQSSSDVTLEELTLRLAGIMDVSPFDLKFEGFEETSPDILLQNLPWSAKEKELN